MNRAKINGVLSQLILPLGLLLGLGMGFLFFMFHEGRKVKHSQNTSFESLEELNLNGVKQWIYITGTKKNNPVLLVLHGGPGFGMLPLFHKYNSELEKSFTVVNWDQRGAGKSFSLDIPRESMTLQQFIDDAHVLTELLKSRFNQKKIYVLGHSSGSMIGVLLVTSYPEDYQAFISVGQVINVGKNERHSYNYVLKRAIEAKETTAIKELKRIGLPDKDGYYALDNGQDITTHWLEYFGATLHGHSNLEKLYDDLFNSTLYKQDIKKLLRGYEFSQLLFDDDSIHEFNAEETGISFQIPVYFISGKFDYDTPIDLVKRYYTLVKAPKKVFIEFEHSAHFPFYEEPQKFNEVMIHRILKETAPRERGVR